jgi:exonuclease SbcC
MIPIRLYLSGFLSYREPVEIDFTAFDLACIAGANGAGKSSLLDAITWALFGQARKRDDSLIHSRSAAAEVGFVFAYEGNIYQARRIKTRDKPAALEFQIWQAEGGAPAESGSATADDNPDRSATVAWPSAGRWKPLTERSLRETELRIQQTLRMDYETFTNASFFLQGKADQFTQQRPGDRKRILGSILGLEVWEDYRQRASERRKLVESEITSLDGRLNEILAELDEEEARQQRLKELEADLARLSQLRLSQEAATQNARQAAARLQEHQRLVEVQARQLEAHIRRAEENQARLEARRAEQQSYSGLLGRAAEIERTYQAWQAKKAELDEIEKNALRFREYDQQRHGPRLEIQAAAARLEQELQGLQVEQSQIEENDREAQGLQEQLEAARTELALAEARLERRARLDEILQATRQRLAEARAEKPPLKAEMDELKERIAQLSQAEGAECPLCGQPLSPVEREALIERLNTEGKELGDRFRANQAVLQQQEEQLRELEGQITELAPAEAEARQQTARQAQLNSRIELLEARRRQWEIQGARRLGEVKSSLEAGSYAPEARLRLAEVDAALKELGYDAAAHDAVRRAEEAGRASEAELRALEKARAALGPLEREIAELDKQSAELQSEAQHSQEEYEKAAAGLAAEQAQAPDLYEEESRLLVLQEQENRLRMDVGAAQQKVRVLETLKARRRDYEAQREALARLVGQYKQLEKAFGKDGVPALLIEQALPEIESKANEMLDRLSGGGMTVRFVTQAAYKDRNREDLRETLDIQISDGAGVRDYEMYSGGEAFRVNFAIRLALSEVLAQRAGARLQTLVIDEGFGSQDAQGRQRLIEAINLVRGDFAKILVITHIDELKDAFPNRIEVEKTEMGSSVQVI